MWYKASMVENKPFMSRLFAVTSLDAKDELDEVI